ncbi:transport protein Sec31 homolog B-like protein isoform X1 [Tanacetum coccineum]
MGKADKVVWRNNMGRHKEFSAVWIDIRSGSNLFFGLGLFGLANVSQDTHSCFGLLYLEDSKLMIQWGIWRERIIYFVCSAKKCLTAISTLSFECDFPKEDGLGKKFENFPKYKEIFGRVFDAANIRNFHVSFDMGSRRVKLISKKKTLFDVNVPFVCFVSEKIMVFCYFDEGNVFFVCRVMNRNNGVVLMFSMDEEMYFLVGLFTDNGWFLVQKGCLGNDFIDNMMHKGCSGYGFLIILVMANDLDGICVKMDLGLLLGIAIHVEYWELPRKSKIVATHNDSPDVYFCILCLYCFGNWDAEAQLYCTIAHALEKTKYPDSGLVEWYAKNDKLCELVNLVVVGGDRRKESKDLEEQAQMKKIHKGSVYGISIRAKKESCRLPSRIEELSVPFDRQYNNLASLSTSSYGVKRSELPKVEYDLVILVNTRPLKSWKETLNLICTSKNVTSEREGKSYVDLLQDLMEKTVVLALATGQKRFSASLCKLVEKYAEILASQGLLTTMEYMKLMGNEDLSPELGSAEVLFSRRSDALQALKRYNYVQLDGRPMRIEIEGSKSEIPISARVSVVGGLNG